VYSWQVHARMNQSTMAMVCIKAYRTWTLFFCTMAKPCDWSVFQRRFRTSSATHGYTGHCLLLCGGCCSYWLVTVRIPSICGPEEAFMSAELLVPAFARRSENLLCFQATKRQGTRSYCTGGIEKEEPWGHSRPVQGSDTSSRTT
jgi:hypothetical protein